MRNKWKQSSLILVAIYLVVLSFITAGTAMSADSDMAITSRVQEKLQSDSHLMASGISVETIDGEVTLKGIVNSHSDHTRAAQLAYGVDGVKKVDNRLKTASAQYGGSSRAADCPVGANWPC
jgi:osmotically-inducible protein OsmY